MWEGHTCDTGGRRVAKYGTDDMSPMIACACRSAVCVRAVADHFPAVWGGGAGGVRGGGVAGGLLEEAMAHIWSTRAAYASGDR